MIVMRKSKKIFLTTVLMSMITVVSFTTGCGTGKKDDKA